MGIYIRCQDVAIERMRLTYIISKTNKFWIDWLRDYLRFMCFYLRDLIYDILNGVPLVVLYATVRDLFA